MAGGRMGGKVWPCWAALALSKVLLWTSTGHPVIPTSIVVPVQLDDTIYELSFTSHDDVRGVAEGFVDRLGGQVDTQGGAGCARGDRRCVADKVAGVMADMARVEQARSLFVRLQLPLDNQVVLLRQVFVHYVLSNRHEGDDMHGDPEGGEGDSHGVTTPWGHTACAGINGQPRDRWTCFEQPPGARTLTLLLDDAFVSRGFTRIDLDLHFHPLFREGADSGDVEGEWSRHTNSTTQESARLSTSVVVNYQPFTELEEPPPPLLPPLVGKRNASSSAIATLLFTDSYLPGALTLFQSLRDTHTHAQLITLIGPHVSQASIHALEKLCDRVIDVRELRYVLPHAPVGTMLPGLGSEVWMKLLLWTLMEYDRVLYLDADAVVLGSVDEVLTTDTMAGADIGVIGGYFSGAVLALTPSIPAYEAMSSMLNSQEWRAAKWDYGEQDFLNLWFDRRHGPGRHGRQQVPGEYHCLADDLDLLPEHHHTPPIAPRHNHLITPLHTHSTMVPPAAISTNETYAHGSSMASAALEGPTIHSARVSSVVSTTPAAAQSASSAQGSRGVMGAGAVGVVEDGVTVLRSLRGDVTREESSGRRCKVVEFMSCGKLRWKPWHDEAPLREEGAKLCRHIPGDAFWAVHMEWKAIYQRALSKVGEHDDDSIVEMHVLATPP